MLPNLGTPGSRVLGTRFPNLLTNASQSWNLPKLGTPGSHVLGPSGSQTFEPMLPNLGTPGPRGPGVPSSRN